MRLNPLPAPPTREISARIRNMEMTARALRQDSGRALKISTAPQSAKAKFSQGRSVKRVVRTVGKRGCSLAGNTLFQLHHKIRFNILSIFLSLCTFFHSTTQSLSSYLPLFLFPLALPLFSSSQFPLSLSAFSLGKTISDYYEGLALFTHGNNH